MLQSKVKQYESTMTTPHALDQSVHLHTQRTQSCTVVRPANSRQTSRSTCFWKSGRLKLGTACRELEHGWLLSALKGASFLDSVIRIHSVRAKRETRKRLSVFDNDLAMADVHESSRKEGTSSLAVTCSS